MSRRPGRCKEIVDVPFERPRTDAVVDSSEFIALRRHLWESLREEQVGGTDETNPTSFSS
jgi:ABC-type nitrate/sulfonate/bicarbonate transport system ATPase subunit